MAYEYSNDHERDSTQKYEGIYSPEEIERNKKLAEACSREPVDFAAVEELLKQGADPLGGTALYGWDLLNHISEEVVCESQDSNSVDLPRLTELFLQYGMDVGKPRIPYDGENSLNPLWSFAFVANENAIIALKMLLDHGLSADDFGKFWGHAVTDIPIVGCYDPQNDEIWNYICVWTFKMLLLGASYDQIWENDEALRDFVCYEYNSGDVHYFRNWDDYELYFDTSRCDGCPRIYGSVVHIREKKTGKELWKIGIGSEGRKALQA